MRRSPYTLPHFLRILSSLRALGAGVSGESLAGAGQAGEKKRRKAGMNIRRKVSGFRFNVEQAFGLI